MPEEFQPYFYKKPEEAHQISLTMLFGICLSFLGLLSLAGGFFSNDMNSASLLYILIGIFVIGYEFHRKK